MGSLKSLAPRLSSLPQRVSALGGKELERTRDAARDREIATRALYKTARWQRLRVTILARDLYTCAFCRKVEGNISRLVCDHIEPHRGNVEKFWTGPFQTLCKIC